LSELTQQVAAWEASKSGRNPETIEQQLAAVQNQLASLQARYTDDYPDVIKTKADIGTAAPLDIMRGVRALIVDDNRTNRRILSGMLQRWAMRAVSVASGEEALLELAVAANRGEPFALLLTDMHMPHMDGFSLVEHIRMRPELSTTVIMMLTSAGHRGDAERCNALGVSAYLMKPIRLSELREAIARALGARPRDGKIPLITRFSLQDAREAAEVLDVLVAEDNPVNQRLAVRLLEKRGHRVTLAGNGREAVEAQARQRFDLILMDVQMPEMDGLEATVAIRHSESGSDRHQPIIALTAHAMKGDQERCLAAGMDGYLTKPIRPQDLDSVLTRYVTNKIKSAARSENGVTALADER
jgi:CheY-like chemotaxis protein